MKKLRHARSPNRVADYGIDDLNNDEVLADPELDPPLIRNAAAVAGYDRSMPRVKNRDGLVKNRVT